MVWPGACVRPLARALTAAPKHAGMGFLVVCDKHEREYGSAEKAAEL